MRSLKSNKSPLGNAQYFGVIISLILFCSFSDIYCLPDEIPVKHPLDSLESVLSETNHRGAEAWNRGEYEAADSLWTITLNIAEKLYSDTDIRFAGHLVNLASTKIELWDFDYALQLFNRAESIYSRIDEQHPTLGSIYQNMAIYFVRQRDYDKAKLYYDQAILLFKNQQPIDYNSLYITYRNLSSLYSKIGDYSQAIEYVEKSIYYDKSKSIDRLVDYYRNIGYFHGKEGEYEKANDLFNKGIDLARRIHLKDVKYLGLPTCLMNYGVFLMDELDDDHKAKTLFLEALKLYKDVIVRKDERIAICYHNLGEVSYNTDQLDSALYYFQLSLIEEAQNFNSKDIYDNPEINVENQKTRILNTLKWKARALRRLYEYSNDISDLEKCLETYLLIFDFIGQMRLKYDNEPSNFLVSTQEDQTFIEGFEVTKLLHDITHEEKYLDIAFSVNEKRKSFTLLTSIRKINAMEFGGIPGYLLNQEKEFTVKLASYEERIFEEEKNRNPNTEKINLWKDERFKILQQYNMLIKTFEDDYPEYYRLKYDVSTLTIDEVQAKLKPDQALIEYTISDSLIFTFIITSNSCVLEKTKLDSTLIKSIDYLRYSLSNPEFSERIRESFTHYKQSSYIIFQRILLPFIQQINNKRFLIIPDGDLWYIPFEVLLTEEVLDSTPNYRDLPYLIREYPISYGYSATLHFDAHQRQRTPVKELLAFAPDYPMPSYAQTRFTQSEPLQPQLDLGFLDNYREHLVPIPGVKEEVKMISRYVPGEILVDDEATETNFKDRAEQYDILHLAMHTIVNNEDPMYSKLAFTQYVDSVNDGFLNTYEIYNMRFNARMAVLSSCKTGFGKLLRGEGVMSLARGFMYAGCPSIIMTLWEVSDKSGAKLMQNFYRGITKGQSKAVALQKAKLDFLSKADNLKANPYFWSTYVIIGDSSPLYPKNRTGLYIGIAALLLLGAGILVFLRERRKAKNADFKQDSIYT